MFLLFVFGILINYNGKKCIIEIQNINIENGRYNNVLVMRRWMFCNIMYIKMIKGGGVYFILRWLIYEELRKKYIK